MFRESPSRIHRIPDGTVWLMGTDFIEGLLRRRRRSYGSLERGEVAEGDRTRLLVAVIVDLFFGGPHGGFACRAASLRAGLTLAEREVISRGVTGPSIGTMIARLLGRSPSTVSREMSRNGGLIATERPLADENAWAASSQNIVIATNPRATASCGGKLRLDWSPEQIAGWF